MLKKFTYFLIIVLFIFLVIELSLRILGYESYKIPKYNFESSPIDCFSASSNMGIALEPGKFEIDINHGLIHTVTHTKDSNRICSIIPIDSFENEIFVFGCSYTYGTGINDSETYSYLLQNEFNKTRFTNFAVPGYGTTHALLQLKKKIALNHIPDIVIIAYATFHEERNQMNKTYQYKLIKGMEVNKKKLKHLIFPYLDIKNNTVQSIDIIKNFQAFPLREKLVFSNLLEQVTLNKQANKLADLRYSKKLFLNILSLCKQYDIKMVVADIAFSDESKNIEDFCHSKKINYVNISPDFTKEGYRNIPFDPHPNKKAHKIYFEKMHSFLKSINFEN